jgi:predicted nuclease of predicted toxin-antitoxin system
MAQNEFKILVDENMTRAITSQLNAKGVTATQVQDVLPEGTGDPEVLEYAYQNGYILLTFDEHIAKHVSARLNEAKEHCGVFIAGDHLQGPNGIGRIIEEIVFYQEVIKAGAASIEDNIYNQINYIK